MVFLKCYQVFFEAVSKPSIKFKIKTDRGGQPQ